MRRSKDVRRGGEGNEEDVRKRVRGMSKYIRGNKKEIRGSEKE